MKTKIGYIIKARFNGHVISIHLKANELHLISRITKGADNNAIEIKRTEYINEDDFIIQRF